MNTYFENSEIFENFDDEVFSYQDGSGEGQKTVDYTQLITKGLETGGQVLQSTLGGRLNEDAKVGIADKKTYQALNKAIRTSCRRKPIRKKKREEWEKCAKQTETTFWERRGQKESDRDREKRMLFTQQENKQKQKQRNLYIGLGVLVVFIGVVVYLKRTS